MDAGIPATTKLGKYLGTQLVHQRHSKAQYAQLVEKYHKRLDSWKTKVLSLVGRITLANSVMTSLPVYHMQMSRLPSSVFKELDKLVRKCIWGSDEEKKKSIWSAGRRSVS